MNSDVEDEEKIDKIGKKYSTHEPNGKKNFHSCSAASDKKEVGNFVLSSRQLTGLLPFHV